MTRLKKLLVAGLMVLVTCCVSMGSALLNITQSIFSWVKASANSYKYENKLDKTATHYEDGDIITVSNLPTEAVKDKTVYIPKNAVLTNVDKTSATAKQAFVEIRNPYGDLLTKFEAPEGSAVKVLSPADDQTQVRETADADGEYHTGSVKYFAFTPSQVGVYTVQYASESAEGIWTVSDIYEINVAAEAYTMEFIDNDPIVMPDKIDTNSTKNTVNLKLPKLYDENGNQITKFALGDVRNGSVYYVAEYKNIAEDLVVLGEPEKVYVYLDNNNVPVVLEGAQPENKNLYDDYYTYEITKLSGSEVDSTTYSHTLYINVTAGGTKYSNSVQQTPEVENLLDLDVTAFAESTVVPYTAAAYSFRAKAGKNIVTYKLSKTNAASGYATPDAYVSYTIDGSSSYDSSNIKIGASASSTVKSTKTSINEKCYLPKVNAVDKNANKNTVNAYYNYTVRFVDESGDKDKYVYAPEYVTMGSDEEGVYFIPHKEGTYNIVYNAKDFYGNTDENAEDYDYDVNVTDRTPATLFFVNSYDFKQEEVDTTDYSYVIPSKYYINNVEGVTEDKWTTIAVPAIFTEDNLKTFDELKISRKITSEDGFKNKSGVVLKNKTLNIQDTDGSTSDLSTDDFDSEGAIFFKNYNEDLTVANSTYVVYNNVFYSATDFDKANLDAATKLTGAALIQAKTSQVAYLKLDPKLFGKGKYTIEYSVQDGRYSNNSGKTFTFELVEVTTTTVDVDTKAPTVKFGTSTVGNVKDNQKITLDKPEIKDEIDNNMLVKYYVVANEKYFEITPDEDGKLTFNTADKLVEVGQTTASVDSLYALATASATKNIRVLAIAFDDFADAKYFNDPALVETDKPANIGLDDYSISVKFVGDTQAPVIESLVKDGVNEDGEIEQYKEISAHGITFTDNTNTAKVSVKVMNSQGVEVDYEELDGSKTVKVADNKYQYTFAGVKFTALEADNYTVVYNIVDGGNNIVTYSFVLKAAADKQAPNISVMGTTATVELGQTYYLKNVSATDNTEGDITFTAKVVGDKVGNRSSWFNTEEMSFTAKTPDTYTITLTAEDANNNKATKTVVVTVKDSTAPTLTLVGSESDKVIYNENEITKDPQDDKKEVFPEVALPGFVVMDANGVNGATGTLTITTPKDKTYTIAINETEVEGENPLNVVRKPVTEQGKTNYYFYFTPTERGHYEATYVAEDLAGNKSKAQVIDVYVGDTEVPIIYLTSDLENELKKGYVIGQNDQLIINPQARLDGQAGYTAEDLYVYDNFGFTTSKFTGTETEYVTVSVQVVNENGNSVTKTEDGGKYFYKFDKQGTYTVTFTVTDKVGNVGTLSKTFKVTAKAATSSDTTKILGTVLIIVSIVILAGVVVYFVRGTKLLPKKNKKAKKQKEDKVENKD